MDKRSCWTGWGPLVRTGCCWPRSGPGWSRPAAANIPAARTSSVLSSSFWPGSCCIWRDGRKRLCAAWGATRRRNGTVCCFCRTGWKRRRRRARAPCAVCGRPSGQKNPSAHRDFLGSLMGMGIVREKVGDILVRPESADHPGAGDGGGHSCCKAGRAPAGRGCTSPRSQPLTLHIPQAPVGGGAGHRLLPAAGCGGLHRTSACPGARRRS